MDGGEDNNEDRLRDALFVFVRDVLNELNTALVLVGEVSNKKPVGDESVAPDVQLGLAIKTLNRSDQTIEQKLAQINQVRMACLKRATVVGFVWFG